jgi:hypothetical protein
MTFCYHIANEGVVLCGECTESTNGLLDAVCCRIPFSEFGLI